MLFKILLLLVSLNLFSQEEEEIIFFKEEKSKVIYNENKDFFGELYFEILPNWHINAREIEDDFLIPTNLKIEENDLSLNEILYPKGEEISLKFSKKPLKVYSKELKVEIKGKLLNEVKNLKGTLSFQGCNDEMCLPPKEISIEIPLSKGVLKDENPLQNWLSKGGVLLALFFLFLGGMALNLTPCVYPMVPITIGFFAKQKKSILHSIIYFLGITITYSLLGTFAALGGSFFGAVLQKPIVLISVSLIIFIFSLSLFGLFTIRMPSSFSTNLAKKGGYISSYLMGALVGLVAAPCIGPIILSLITFVASKGDPFLGFIFFFSLSFGLALPYLFFSFFSSSLKSLPKAGEWMVTLERFFGFALIGVAIFILKPLLSVKVSGILFLFLGFLGTIYFLMNLKKKKSILNFLFAFIFLIFFLINFSPFISKPKEEK